MRKLLLGTLFLLSLSMNAQEDDTQRRNIIKTNVTAFAFKNFQLNYERVFTKTFSLSVSYGMIPEGKLPFSSLLPNDSEVNLEEVELGGSNATLETRFYLGKKGYGLVMVGRKFRPFFMLSFKNLVGISSSKND